MGIRVVELAGLGPAPFAAMLLADLGADVIRVDRADGVDAVPVRAARTLTHLRGRRSVALDLKHADGVATVLELVGTADGLIEGFRPGVMERLGLGPEACRARNPALVYGRMTGWGQTGPYAAAAGHDINYISLAGALAHIGRAGGPPVPPLNLVGDFGGGGMLLAVGLLAGLLHARTTGEGQVVDAAMVDGTAALMTMIRAFQGIGRWNEERGTNGIDTGSPYYDVYETSDGAYVSIGAVEPAFFQALLRAVGLDPADHPQHDPGRWPATKAALAAVFRTRTRAEWCEQLEGTDVCFAPVLTMSEAPQHPHNVSRATFVDVDGVVQAAPAPRFEATPGALRLPPAAAGEHTTEVLAELGYPAEQIDALLRSGAARALSVR